MTDKKSYNAQASQLLSGKQMPSWCKGFGNG